VSIARDVHDLPAARDARGSTNIALVADWNAGL
jgi:hypothetical protein